MPNSVGVIVIDEGSMLLETALENLIAEIVDVERISAAIVDDEINRLIGKFQFARDGIDNERAAFAVTIDSVEFHIRPFVEVRLVADESRLHSFTSDEKEGNAHFRKRAECLHKLLTAFSSVKG